MPATRCRPEALWIPDLIVLSDKPFFCLYEAREHGRDSPCFFLPPLTLFLLYMTDLNTNVDLGS
jgi:hypothetical protein